MSRNLQKQKFEKQAQQRSKCGWWKAGGGGRGSSFSRHSFKQYFALNFSHCWGVHIKSAPSQFNWILCTRILHFQELQGSLLWKQRSSALGKVRLKTFLIRLWKHFCLNLFLPVEWNCLIDPLALCCMVNRMLTSFPPLICYIQKWKLGYFWSEPDLIFTCFLTTPTLVIDFLFIRFTLVVLLSKLFITRNEYIGFHMLPWITVTWRIQVRFSSFLLNTNRSSRKTFWTMLQFFELPLQWIETLHSLDRILKIHSDISNSMSDKLNYSEEASQS